MSRVVILLLVLLASTAQGAIIADHRAVAEFDSIPEAMFTDLKNVFSGFYGHSSHGSQLVTGLNMLAAENVALYEPFYIREWGLDLATEGDLTWATQSRTWLDAHPETNIVLWAWCSGMSINTVEGVNIYLEAMDQLETEYPDVVFVYMTGHTDGTGDDGRLRRNNNLVRDFCIARDKVLFDFADIESWDPDGVFYPDEEDDCLWCETWCATHDCPTCDDCAHSHCFNCYRKGKAVWWMLARLQGWEISPNEQRSLGSLKAMFR